MLKRFDSSKLYVLACQDIVERFHLLITLAFVVVEEMASSGHTTPNPAILVQVQRGTAGGGLGRRGVAWGDPVPGAGPAF